MLLNHPVKQFTKNKAIKEYPLWPYINQMNSFQIINIHSFV